MHGSNKKLSTPLEGNEDMFDHNWVNNFALAKDGVEEALKSAKKELNKPYKPQ